MSTFEHCDPIKKREGDARQLLTMLARAGNGYLVITTICEGTVLAKSFTCDEVDAAVKYALAKSKTANVYVGAGLRDKPFNGSAARGTAEEVSSISALWLDVDYLSPAHKQTALPADHAAAMEIVQSFGLPPTAIINSGHGLQLWYELDAPFIIASDEDRKRIHRVLSGFEQAFRVHMQQYGYHLDSVAEPAHVMRVSGTANRKTTVSCPSSVTTLQWDDNVTYGLSDFPLADKPKRSKSKAYKGHPKGTKTAKSPKAEKYPPANFDRILDGCGWMGHVQDDAAGLAEPEWHLAAGIALRCINGRKRFHEMSKPYPTYEASETDLKLDRAEDVSPVRCETIHQHTGGRYCGSCPFWTGISTPLQLGRPHSGKAIDVAVGDLPEQSGKAWAAVFMGNTPPKLFQTGAGLARLDRQHDGPLVP